MHPLFSYKDTRRADKDRLPETRMDDMMDQATRRSFPISSRNSDNYHISWGITVQAQSSERFEVLVSPVNEGIS